MCFSNIKSKKTFFILKYFVFYFTQSFYTVWIKHFRDCRQTTFVVLNRFCSLSKRPPHPLFLMDNISKNGYNTDQNQLKNTCRSYIVFKVLKVYTSYKNFSATKFFILCYFYQLLHQQISFFTNFFTDFCHKYSFFKQIMQPLPPIHPLNSQNLLSVTEVFC